MSAEQTGSVTIYSKYGLMCEFAARAQSYLVILVSGVFTTHNDWMFLDPPGDDGPGIAADMMHTTGTIAAEFATLDEMKGWLLELHERYNKLDWQPPFNVAIVDPTGAIVTEGSLSDQAQQAYQLIPRLPLIHDIVQENADDER